MSDSSVQAVKTDTKRAIAIAYSELNSGDLAIQENTVTAVVEAVAPL
jgi:hypothetical protein